MGRPTAQLKTVKTLSKRLGSIVSSQRGPRQQAPQGHNNGSLGFLWASKPAVCQPLNP